MLGPICEGVQGQWVDIDVVLREQFPGRVEPGVHHLQAVYFGMPELLDPGRLRQVQGGVVQGRRAVHPVPCELLEMRERGVLREVLGRVPPGERGVPELLGDDQRVPELRSERAEAELQGV